MDHLPGSPAVEVGVNEIKRDHPARVNSKIAAFTAAAVTRCAIWGLLPPWLAEKVNSRMIGGKDA